MTATPQEETQASNVVMMKPPTAGTAAPMIPISDAAQATIEKLGPNDPLSIVRRRREKIAILGFTQHRDQAMALDRSEWALWGLNELYRYMPLERFDLWCEIHNWEDLAKETPEQVPSPWPRHVEVMAKGFDGYPPLANGFSIPIYMQDARPDVRMSYKFPKEIVEGDLPGRLGEYKTSAPAWMLGFAIALDFREIHLYGIDMATDTEYAEQRPCMEFLLGVAAGRGIKVYVPPESDLISSIGQYAFGTGDSFTRKMVNRRVWLQDQMKHHRDLHAQIESAYKTKKAELEELYRVEKSRCEGAIHEILGQLNNMAYLQRAWAVPVSASDHGPHPDRTQDERTGITVDSVLARAGQQAAQGSGRTTEAGPQPG